MEALLVALIVAGATAFAAWKLLPATWLPRALRQRLPPPADCGSCPSNTPARESRSRTG